MILTLEEAKRYLRQPGSHEDEDVTAIIIAAETYISNAGIVLSADNELAKMAIKMLVVHWYENREPIGQTNLIALGLSSIITQLQNC